MINNDPLDKHSNSPIIVRHGNPFNNGSTTILKNCKWNNGKVVCSFIN